MTYPVISLKPSYNSVIRGCPGLPDTLPRIECQLRVRSNDSLPFRLVKIEIILKTIEIYFIKNLYSSNNNSLTPFNRSSDSPKDSPDTINKNTTVHYKKNVVLSHPTHDGNNSDLIGIDIPLTIGLPDDIKETNYNPKFGKTQTFLDCTVFYANVAGASSNKKRSFLYPINVERYTYLPSPSYFKPINRQNVTSPDQKFLINYSIENSCVSMNNDVLKLSISIRLNPFRNSTIASSPNDLDVSTPTLFSTKKKFKSKLKLKSVTTQVQEYLEILKNRSEFSSAQTSNVLQTSVKQVDQTISMNAMLLQFNLKIFTKDKFFQSFEDSDLGCPETKLLINKIDDIPLQYHNSVSTIGQHFNVSHSLSIRFKFNKSLKNFEINHPLIISFWSISQLPLVENLISQERQTAKFAKKFYKNFGRIKNASNSNNSSNCLEYPSLPPIIYNFNDSEVNNRFNILYLQKDISRIDPSKLKRVPVIQ
ncbi:YPL066W [Saccharomyces arboricola H-6]|uniref:YPL066W n=1 Tax=Saccharomyces arboricola (strain H-6 / AS 2.3317 / CBS 10644) TaxID=1160507 RepID=J8Q147_SACAR|nr:YPL066W [Saccharomyces arboricola H-6]